MAKYKANKEKEANLLKGSESDRTTVDKTGWYKSDPKYLKKKKLIPSEEKPKIE